MIRKQYSHSGTYQHITPTIAHIEDVRITCQGGGLAIVKIIIFIIKFIFGDNARGLAFSIPTLLLS